MDTIVTKNKSPSARTILVIGDEQWCSNEIETLLSGRADTLIEAATMDAALDYLSKHPVDLILLQATSARSAAAVEQITNAVTTPIVAIGESDAVDAAVVAGAADFLLTPCSRAALVQRINLVIETELAAPFNALEQAADIDKDYGSTTVLWELDLRSQRLIWSASIDDLLGAGVADRTTSLDQLRQLLHPEDLQELNAGLDYVIANSGDTMYAPLRLKAEGEAAPPGWLDLIMTGERVVGEDYVYGTLRTTSATDNVLQMPETV